MSYAYSQLDNDNLKWFPNDASRQTLQSIRIVQGNIRGLRDLSVEFTYPITAIAGQNGSGKTTVLALAACAFHNNLSGYRLLGRNQSYYTFADFFVQSADDVPLDGVEITYGILSKGGRQKSTTEHPEGLVYQSRIKKRGSRWNDYDVRVRRNVAFLGVERVVPHSERSASKRQKGSFASSVERGWERSVKETVSRILDRPYSSFVHKAHSKYRISVVKGRAAQYSGFNMGAGESALFELLSVIYECPSGALFLIDEIELGLHEEAQARLILELKKLCKDRGVQIICTTHSARVLEALPPEGRLFLERVDKDVVVTPGIAGKFATRKLTGIKNVELDVLVEDVAAKTLLIAAMTQELRSRVEIIEVGSATAVIRHMVARYIERSRCPEVVVLLDGDQRSKLEEHIRAFSSAIERKEWRHDAKAWCSDRVSFLCGSEWPEKWVVEQCGSGSGFRMLAEKWGMSVPELTDILDRSALAGKHNEFYTASELTGQNQLIVANDLAALALAENPVELDELQSFLKKWLQGIGSTSKVQKIPSAHPPKRRSRMI